MRRTDAPDGAAAGLGSRQSPPRPLTGIPPVVRLRIDGLVAQPRALVLFQGALGSYYSTELAAGEVPSTLATRRVPHLAWADQERGELVAFAVDPAR